MAKNISFLRDPQTKAIKLNNNAHEFYFGLAKVHYMLENNVKAQQYLKKLSPEITLHNLINNTSQNLKY